MATFPINPSDIIEFSVWQTYQGSRLLNIFHYQMDPAAPPIADGETAMEQMLDTFELKFYGAAGPIPTRTHISLQYNFMRGQVVYPTRRYYVPLLMGYTGVAGPIAADAPSDLQRCMTLRSAVVGRGVNGRKAFGGMLTTDFAGPLWSNGSVNDWQTVVCPLFDDELAQPPALWNLIPKVWNPRRPTVPSDIAVSLSQEEVRVQRRRQLRLGV